MADVFDTFQESPQPASDATSGDIFDTITASSGGDIFDSITATTSPPQESLTDDQKLSAFREQSSSQMMSPRIAAPGAREILAAEQANIASAITPLTTKVAAKVASGLEKGMATTEKSIRGALDFLGFYGALDETLGTGTKYRDYNRGWLEYFNKREQQLAKEDADLGATGFGYDVAEGVARAGVELPTQLLGGAAGAVRGAAVKGAAITAGATSGLSQYAQDRGAGKDKTESAIYSGVSGAITVLTTAAFGNTGVESIFRNEGVRGVGSRLLMVLKQAGLEGAEESVDQFQQDLLERTARNPNKPIGDSVREILLAGSIGSLIGGAASSLSELGGGGMKPEQAALVAADAPLTATQIEGINLPELNAALMGDTLTPLTSAAVAEAPKPSTEPTESELEYTGGEMPASTSFDLPSNARTSEAVTTAEPSINPPVSGGQVPPPPVTEVSPESAKVGTIISADDSRAFIKRIRSGDERSKRKGRNDPYLETPGELEIVDIPISAFRDEHIQFLRDSTDADRVKSYQSQDIQTPVYAVPSDMGGWRINDGGHRLLAAIESGKTSVRAAIPTGDRPPFSKPQPKGGVVNETKKEKGQAQGDVLAQPSAPSPIKLGGAEANLPTAQRETSQRNNAAQAELIRKELEAMGLQVPEPVRAESSSAERAKLVAIDDQKSVTTESPVAGQIPIEGKPSAVAIPPPRSIEIKSGDTIRWEPNANEQRYQSAVEGTVVDVISNQEGERGYHILAPLEGDPSRVVRVWENRGKIVQHEPSKVEGSNATQQGLGKPTGPSASSKPSQNRTQARPKSVTEIADEIAERGIDPQASYGEFVKARDLKPEISAKDWLPIYRRSLALASLDKKITKPIPPAKPSAAAESRTPLQTPIEAIESVQKAIRKSTRKGRTNLGILQQAVDLALETIRISLKAGDLVAVAFQKGIAKAIEKFNSISENDLRAAIEAEIFNPDRKESQGAFRGLYEPRTEVRYFVEAERFIEGKTSQQVLDALALFAGGGSVPGLSQEIIPMVLSKTVNSLVAQIATTPNPAQFAELNESLDRAARLFQQQGTEPATALQARKSALQNTQAVAPYLTLRGLITQAWQKALKVVNPTEEPTGGIRRIVRESAEDAGEEVADQVEAKEEENQSENSAQRIIDDLAKSQSDTLSWSQKQIDGVRETVKWFIQGDITDAELIATMDMLKIEDNTTRVLLGVAQREAKIHAEWIRRRSEESQARRVNQAEMRKVRAAAMIAFQIGLKPVKEAEALLARYAESQSDTQSWPEKIRSQIKEAFAGLLSGDITEDEFRASLDTVGVAGATTQSLIGVARRELATREYYRQIEEQRKLDSRLDRGLTADVLKAIKESGIKLSTLFLDTPHATQAERRKHLFDQIRAKFPNLTSAQAVKLEKALMDAWEEARLKVFRQQFKKYVGLPDIASENILDQAQPELIRAANVGTLTEESFQAAIARVLGLPELTGPQAQKMIQLSQEAQAAPEGILKNKKLAEMVDLMNQSGQFHPFDIWRDYWYANALSGTRTWVNVLSSVFHGLDVVKSRTIDLAARGKFQAAAAVPAAWTLDLVEGFANAIDVVATGDYTRRAEYGQNITALLSGKGRRDTLEGMLKHGDALWKRALGLTAFSRRMIVGLDYVSAISTRGSEIIYGAALSNDADQLEKSLKRFNRVAAKQAKQQAQTELGKDAKWVDVRARQLEILNEGVNEQTIAQAMLIGEIVALNAPLVGFTGAIHSGVNAGLRSFGAALSDDPKTSEAIATSIHFVMGSAFLRAMLNMVANATNYMPGVGAVNYARSFIKPSDGTKTGAAMRILAMLDEDGQPMSQQRRQMILSAQLTGLGMAAGVLALAMRYGDSDDEEERKRFDITGMWKGMDWRERKARMDKGERPLSILYRGRYYSYANQPMAGALVAIGNIRDNARQKGPAKQPSELYDQFASTWWMTPLYVKDISMVSGMANVLGIAATKADESKALARLLQQEARTAITGTVPFASLVSEIDSWFDPKIYKPETWQQFVLSAIPWMRESAGHGPNYNMAGIPVESPRTPQSRIVAKQQIDPLLQELGKLVDRGIVPKIPVTSQWIASGEVFTPTQKSELTYRHQVETLKAWRTEMLAEGDAMGKMSAEEYADYHEKYLLPISREIHDTIQDELDPDVLKRTKSGKYEVRKDYEIKPKKFVRPSP